MTDLDFEDPFASKPADLQRPSTSIDFKDPFEKPAKAKAPTPELTRPAPSAASDFASGALSAVKRVGIDTAANLGRFGGGLLGAVGASPEFLDPRFKNLDALSDEAKAIKAPESTAGQVGDFAGSLAGANPLSIVGSIAGPGQEKVREGGSVAEGTGEIAKSAAETVPAMLLGGELPQTLSRAGYEKLAQTLGGTLTRRALTAGIGSLGFSEAERAAHNLTSSEDEQQPFNPAEAGKSLASGLVFGALRGHHEVPHPEAEPGSLSDAANAVHEATAADLVRGVDQRLATPALAPPAERPDFVVNSRGQAVPPDQAAANAQGGPGFEQQTTPPPIAPNPPAPAPLALEHQPDVIVDARGRAVVNKGDRSLGQPFAGAGIDQQAPAGQDTTQPWQMTRDQYRQQPGVRAAVNAGVIERAGTDNLQGIADYYAKKYGLSRIRVHPVDGAHDSLAETRTSVQRGDTVYNIDIPKDSPFAAEILRHEIEHVIDKDVHGFDHQQSALGDRTPGQMSKYEHDTFTQDYEHRRQVKEALARGENVPASVLADYPDLRKNQPAPVPGPLSRAAAAIPQPEGVTNGTTEPLANTGVESGRATGGPAPEAADGAGAGGNANLRQQYAERQDRIDALNAKRKTEGLSEQENTQLHDLRDEHDNYDALTGLLNQKGYDNAVRAGGYTHSAALDLDQFKPLNDTFGHQAGDLVLQHVAQVLHDSSGGDVTVARLHGDEYAGLAKGDPTAAMQKAQDTLRSTPVEITYKDKDGNETTHTLPGVGITFGVGSDYAAADAAANAAKPKGGRRGTDQGQPSVRPADVQTPAGGTTDVAENRGLDAVPGAERAAEPVAGEPKPTNELVGRGTGAAEDAVPAGRRGESGNIQSGTETAPAAVSGALTDRANARRAEPVNAAEPVTAGTGASTEAAREAGSGRAADSVQGEGTARVGGETTDTRTAVPHAAEPARDLNPRDNPEAFGLPAKPKSPVAGKPNTYIPGPRDFNEHHHDLLDFAALHGGLDPKAWRSAGVDRAQIRPGKDSRGSMRFPRAPLWRNGGMTPDMLREAMVERGFLPPDSEHGEANSEANHAIDKVLGALNQDEKHYTYAGQETQSAIDYLERAHEEQAQANALARERGFESADAMREHDAANFMPYDGSPREDIPFSKPAQKPGMSRAALSGAIHDVVSKWQGDAPRVQVLQSHADAPPALRNARGFGGDVEGAYHNGTTYLFADAIRSPKRALEVLGHEAFGHYGMERAFAKEWPKLVKDITALREKAPAYMRKVFAEVDRRYPGADAETRASETLAVMAEKGIHNALMDRVFATMRKFLRSLGFDLKFSDAELRQMLVAAKRRVEGERSQESARQAQPAFAKRDTVSGDMFGAPAREEKPVAEVPKTGDMFGGATSRDHVDAAVRAKEDALSGKGAAPTMRQGAGELFAGDRPEQKTIPEKSQTKVDEIRRDLADSIAKRDAIRDKQTAMYANNSNTRARTTTMNAEASRWNDRITELREMLKKAEAEQPKFSKAEKTDSPEFKRWFGKSAVEKDGKPTVVYHGTGEDFNVFERGKLGESTQHATAPLGFHFTTDRVRAEHYAENASEGRPANERVISAYLKVENPYRMKLSEAQAVETPAEAKALRAKLEAAGHDGIQIPEAKTWIAFKPEQVKSVDNRGSFDASNPDIRFSKADREQRDLIVQHNLTAEKLAHADRMGGLPVPSLAITRDKHPLAGFGDITLLGDKSLANPRESGAKVYGADAYSPRYPEVQYKVVGKALKKLNETLAPFRKEGDRELYGDEITRVDDLTGDNAFKAYVKANDLDGKYSETRAVAEKMLRDSGAEERLFKGYTYSGNRMYKPHTLENVVKELKKNLRGGENFNYGTGTLRAKFTPQFRSIEQIRKEKGRLVSKADFEKVKEDVNTEFFGIVDDLRGSSPRGKDFSFTDTVLQVLEDAPKMGLQRALADFDMPHVTDETKARMAQFLTHLRNMPTEYFEGVIPRAVGLHEFKAAVVPHDTPASALSILQKHGLDVEKYQRGDEEDRKRAINALADRGTDIRFSVADRKEADKTADAIKQFAKDNRENVRNDARSALAKSKRNAGTAMEAVRAMRDEFDKRIAAYKGDFKKLYAGISALERGEKTDDPLANALWQSSHALLGEQLQRLNALGADIHERVNYFSHIWKDQGRAVEEDTKKAEALPIGQRRPLAGNKYYTKERVFETIMDGLNAGREPISANPVDMFMARYAQGEKLAAALNIRKAIEDRGLVQQIEGDRVPHGYARVNDGVFAGKALPELIARDLNNHLDPGLSKYKAWRDFRYVQNLMLSSRLGLSMFHAGMTTLDSIATHVDVGMRRALGGDLKGAMHDLFAATRAPLTAAQELAGKGAGSKLVRQWYGKEAADANTRALLDMAMEGGARARMDSTDYNHTLTQFRRAWVQGDVRTQVKSAVPAAIELTTHHIAQNLVPAQKMTARVLLLKFELDRLADKVGKEKGDYAGIKDALGVDAIRQISRKVNADVDDRLGQFAYENEFWNRVLKDAAHASIQSVGWNFGSIRLIAGGLKDLGNLAKPETFRGEGPLAGQKMSRLTNRLSYLITLNAVVAAMGAMTQYALTGQAPQEPKDYFFPKTGRKNPDDSDERLAFPSYVKDEYAFSHHPLQTIQHKLHPSLSMAAEMFQNKDFYGNEIVDPEAPWPQEAKEFMEYLGKSFLPYSIQGANKNLKSSDSIGMTAAPFFGVTPAPGDVTKSPFQQYISERYYETKAGETKTPEQAAQAQALSEAINAKKAGKPVDTSKLLPWQKAFLNKPMQPLPQHLFEKMMSPRGGGGISIQQALHAYDVATPAERDRYHLAQIIRKTAAAKIRQLPPDEQQDVRARLNALGK